MADFTNLKSLEVHAEKRVDYTLFQIAGEPVLELAPATEANKPYHNALLRRSRRNQRRIQAGAIDAALMAENREDDRSLYAEFIIKGWRRMLDAQGKPVPFTLENVKDFLNALPNWLFDEVRLFASNSQNFVPEVSINVEEAAGNSPTA